VSLGFFSDVCWVTAVKLYEFEDSDLFRWEGIPVPDYGVAGSHWEVCWKAEVIWLPAVVKVQVRISPNILWRWWRWSGNGWQLTAPHSKACYPLFLSHSIIE
tara:strand:+ start:643 stop:948 length:306 start_codon:yes stop_codon:yes gene_type:complete